MYSNKKFGLSDSLIEAARKVAEATSVPTVKPPTPEEQKKKDANKKRFLAALKGEKKTLAKEEQEINELVVPDKKSVSAGSVSDYLRNRSKNKGMGTPFASAKPPATERKSSGSGTLALPKPNRVAALPAPDKPKVAASTPKETPHELISTHQKLHTRTAPAGMGRTRTDAAKLAAEVEARQRKHSSVNRKPAVDAPIGHIEDKYQKWKSQGRPVTLGSTGIKGSSLPSGDTKKTVSVNADSPPKQTTVTVEKEPSKAKAAVKSLASKSAPAARKTGTISMSTGTKTVPMSPASVTAAKTTTPAKAAVKTVTAKSKTTGKADPLRTEKMAGIYKQLQSAGSKKEHDEIVNKMREDGNVRKAEAEHLLTHHYGYTGPKMATKGAIFDHIAGLHGKAESKYEAKPRAAPRKRFTKPDEGESFHTHYLKQLRRAHSKGDHATMSELLKDIHRDTTNFKGPELQTLAKAYTKGLPTKPTRANVMDHMKSHFETTHGALKEEFVFFEEDILEAFSDYELDLMTKVILENK